MNLVLSLLLAMSCLIAHSCDRSVGDKERGEPCTSDAVCDRDDGLVCRGGTCDYPADGATQDAT